MFMERYFLTSWITTESSVVGSCHYYYLQQQLSLFLFLLQFFFDLSPAGEETVLLSVQMELLRIAAVTGAANKQIEGGVSRRNRKTNEELLNSNGGGGEGGISSREEEQVIRWESFLPRKFLRVLLVENDDSTRHIVSALLRKCNYHVSAVADGIKAWKVLKERHYNFDIVLTELVMPTLSGMGLLSKIMDSEICKTIPVIMMSSNDSIGIVFKCMLKGAADFLVKPVRKNELRNLWQHVWRKYCSSSCGDVSENGNPNLQTKLDTVSDNEVASSNHGSGNAGNRFKTRDSSESSDKGSGTQSSCRKPDIEIESGQKSEVPLEIENMIFLEDADSNLEKNASFDTTKLATSSVHEKRKAKDKSVEIETKVTLSIHEAVTTEKVWWKTGPYEHREEEPASLRSKEGGNIGPKSTDQNDGTKKLPKQVIEFIGRAITTRQYGNPVVDHNDHREDVLYASASSSDTSRNICCSGSSPLLELSLRSSQPIPREENIQAKHALNHSVASAFSRYKNASSVPSPRTGSSPASLFSKTNECRISGHICSSANNGITFPHGEMSTSPHGAEGRVQCHLSSGCDKEDADPSPSVPSRVTAYMDICFPKNEVPVHPQLGVVPFCIPVGAIPFQSMSSGYGSIVQPIFHPEPSLRLCGSAEGHNENMVMPSNPSDQYSNHLINNLQHVNPHHSVGNPHPFQLKQVMKVQRFDIESTYPRVMFQPPAEKANVGGNCFVAIASGSIGNHEGMSVVGNPGTALEGGNEDGIRNCYEKGLDINDRSRREEALNKFRMKRKERCFEKKVRYHNRKKLAEQRPRLKGQFVRQAVGESTTKASEQDD